MYHSERLIGDAMKNHVTVNPINTLVSMSPHCYVSGTIHIDVDDALICVINIMILCGSRSTHVVFDLGCVNIILC
jgi:hypothetical protein